MKYDAVILGGGPAAVSAALTLRARGKTAAILSGGIDDIPLSRASRITNYPGCPDISGRALLEAMEEQAPRRGRGNPSRSCHVDRAPRRRLRRDLRRGLLRGGNTDPLHRRCRRKAFPGERELLGRGVSYCVTCDGMLYRGKRSASWASRPIRKEEAELLRTMGCEVEMFTGRTAKYAVLGQERVTALSMNGEEHPCEAVFILRPAAAPDTLLAGLAMDGVHVAVDKATTMKTSVAGVFAAGDCTGKPLPDRQGRRRRAHRRAQRRAVYRGKEPGEKGMNESEIKYLELLSKSFSEHPRYGGGERGCRPCWSCRKRPSTS